MQCYVATPRDERGGRGVIVLGGTDGISGHIRTVSDALAEEGMAAIAPDLFHRGKREPAEGAPTSSTLYVHELLTDIDAAQKWLAASGTASLDHIGVLGFTMGGIVAYLASGVAQNLKATVVFSPSYVFKPLGEGTDVAPFDVSPEIGCPILLFSGQDDWHPSPEDMARIEEELTRLGKVHEVHVYPGVGHGRIIFVDPAKNPSPAVARAGADAWKRTTDWFRRYL